MRGPAGAGKSSVKNKLINIISDQNIFKSYSKFNLDQVEESKFDQNMKQALETEIVIGEMFSGDQHTTNPETWIPRFQESMNFFVYLESSKRNMS